MINGALIETDTMKFAGIIPARYASTRFPGKPLAMLGGKPMIQRVYEQVKDCFDELYVATDDERIFDAVSSFGGNVVMTSEDCKNGTERCLDAYKRLGLDCDVIVNIQGDEPFIQPKQIQALLGCFDDSGETDIATLVKPFEPADGIERLECPNSPKVVLDKKGYALYFSRSAKMRTVARWIPEVAKVTAKLYTPETSDKSPIASAPTLPET